MFHNVYTFFSVHNCLDEDFDAPDAMADAELGRAIVAGRCGVHPDGWGNQNSLTAIMPLGFRKHEWTRPEPAPPSGEVQLTCDECKALFRITMYYRGNRPAVVQSIRLLGKDEGWTCIAGTDRCPGCSLAAAPQAVGNGTGKDQGHKQHT